jgi:Zn finger protein HypA/HybF involved in hydrogenase expression
VGNTWPAEQGAKNMVGKGWQPIALDAAEQLEANGAQILQVKEKFGGLRIYFQVDEDTSSVDVYDKCNEIVRLAEEKAAITCEDCGQPGSMTTNRSFYRTLCPECIDK